MKLKSSSLFLQQLDLLVTEWNSGNDDYYGIPYIFSNFESYNDDFESYNDEHEYEHDEWYRSATSWLCLL